jgi:hypothetical protein
VEAQSFMTFLKVTFLKAQLFMTFLLSAACRPACRL